MQWCDAQFKYSSFIRSTASPLNFRLKGLFQLIYRNCTWPCPACNIQFLMFEIKLSQGFHLRWHLFDAQASSWIADRRGIRASFFVLKNLAIVQSLPANHRLGWHEHTVNVYGFQNTASIAPVICLWRCSTCMQYKVNHSVQLMLFDFMFAVWLARLLLNR